MRAKFFHSPPNLSVTWNGSLERLKKNDRIHSTKPDPSGRMQFGLNRLLLFANNTIYFAS